MAKQRDTLASLRKKITQLETTIRAYDELIAANNKKIIECTNEKSILVTTIAHLTGTPID